MFKQKFRPHTRQSFGAVFLCVGLLFVVQGYDERK